MLDSFYNARKLTDDADLMSRMAMILSGNDYPYQDKAHVFKKVKEFLNIATTESGFLIGEAPEICNLHYNLMQPITLSAKALDIENAVFGVEGDLDTLRERLDTISEVVNKVELGESVDPQSLAASEIFFSSLEDCFDALANEELLDSVGSPQSVALYANG